VDLAAAGVAVESPCRGRYRGTELLTCGPWSQGPVLAMALQILEGVDLSAAGPGSADALHAVAEALKLSLADRDAFFGDPEHVDVPIEGLLDQGYAAMRRTRLDVARASPSLPAPGDPWPFEGRTGGPGHVPRPADGPGGPDTTFVAVMDAAGNAFAATPSDPAMLGPVVPGLGVTVSTRGSMLWLEPDHPSVIAPGKRPRLTCNPALLAEDGVAVMAFGCPGADAQTQAMVQVVINLVDHGLDLQAAIESPRVISTSVPSSIFPHAWRPGGLAVESRIDPVVRAELARRGHRIEPLPAFAPQAAGVSAVRRRPNGVLEAGADPRREGSAIGR
jgi:gamma-glutamyltranspeptidase / glutathione hydrolase